MSCPGAPICPCNSNRIPLSGSAPHGAASLPEADSVGHPSPWSPASVQSGGDTYSAPPAVSEAPAAPPNSGHYTRIDAPLLMEPRCPECIWLEASLSDSQQREVSSRVKFVFFVHFFFLQMIFPFFCRAGAVRTLPVSPRCP